jgi:LacI family transcriptional regulator
MTEETKSHTMIDVARLAGVSVATVSAVVNNKDGVSAEKIRRVKEAMAALDYHPDHVARNLKVGRTHIIGMIVPDITNPFYTEVVSGLETEALRNGYTLILCNSGEDPQREQHYLDMLFSRRVDGVVLACADSSAAYDRLIRRRFPLVFVDRIPVGYTRAAVTTDNVAATYEATRHLIELGHTRIAIIGGRLLFSNGIDRVEGFRKAMQEAHLPVRAEYFCSGDFQIESGYKCGLDLMRLREPPTAVLACNNKMTLGLVRALGELRVPCPEQVSVLGFDDFEWAANFSPKLTTVAQPMHEMGRQAMNMLMDKIKSSAGDSNGDLEIPTDSLVMLKAELRIRESTVPPASR